MGLQRNTKAIVETSVSRKENFNRGNVWGRWKERGTFRSSHIGQLPTKIAKVLNEHSKNADLFVLYSYQTPMAWYSLNDSDSNGTGKWYYVDQYYSASTTQHQAAYRYALKGENVVTLSLFLDTPEIGTEVVEDEKEYY